MSAWFRDGVACESIPIDDRGLQYGDGVFETIAIRDGSPRLWRYHVDRLVEGCKCLRITPPAETVLRGWLEHALRSSAADVADCVAKIIVTAGVSQRGYGRLSPSEANTLVGLFPTMPLAADAYKDGVETILCRTRLACGSATAGFKTLNRIEQVLARSECLAAGAFEGLTLDADERLICGTMSNVFIVSNKVLITPSVERSGVAGVMRRHVIDCLEAAGISVQIGDITEQEFNAADEVFLCNSQFGVLPVRSCGAHQFGVGELTRRAMALLAGNGIGECAV